ncbi:hypothetical protein PHSC3_001904 [Chlamydiales bacterium STE3]|nr:hypothetical protein PHSC3_001904 [Chlamydiales bacterium STE3]
MKKLTFMMLSHHFELNFIHKLQATLRSPFMDYFFLTWNFVDTFNFLLLLIAAAWYLIDKRFGIRLFVIFTLSAFFNSFFKNLFNLPRPSQIDPSVGLLYFSSAGFPSGAAQTAFLIAGIICTEYKEKIYRAGAVVFALLLCFSRIYLGAHFFSDIAGGLIVGSLLLWIYKKWLPVAEGYGKGVFFMLSLLLLYANQPALGWLSLGVATGISLDNDRIIYLDSLPIRLLKALTAVSGVCLLMAVKSVYVEQNLVLTFLGGLWFSYLGAFITQKILEKIRKSPLLFK